MNYDFRNIWDQVGKFFYSINFSFFISALFVWDSSLLELLPRFLSGDTNNLLFSVLFFISIISLFIYYIFDWLDATIVSSIDGNVTWKDVVVWLLAPLLLSIVVAILVKKSPDSGYWLYAGYGIYLLINCCVLLGRDKRISSKKTKLFADPNIANRDEIGKKYDLIHLIGIAQKAFGWVYCFGVIVIFAFLICFWCHNETITYKDTSYKVVLLLFSITILINTIIKIFRFRYVNLPDSD